MRPAEHHIVDVEAPISEAHQSRFNKKPSGPAEGVEELPLPDAGKIDTRPRKPRMHRRWMVHPPQMRPPRLEIFLQFMDAQADKGPLSKDEHSDEGSGILKIPPRPLEFFIDGSPEFSFSQVSFSVDPDSEILTNHMHPLDFSHFFFQFLQRAGEQDAMDAFGQGEPIAESIHVI